ncbi:MAG: transposase [Deltaproteobacteria bacterium]|jgi:putative transposase|uniref:REP-associated tyrosine transposase n=1 Tax=Hydrosulfovibrio ferrireducens TaxID=2934181 RepID=UPI0011F92A84|nr:MAG: transposase [Deltaproteobacteria bacterium]
MQYRRSRAKGAAFFFTVVTHGRRRFLCDETNIKLIREAFQHVVTRHPFTVDAFVLLPDHLHCIWTLPENDSDFSMRWRQIKSYFSRKCRDKFKGGQADALLSTGKQAIWQHRFWEHQIRDETDFVSHVEYIHYNPVKHGLATSPKAWPHSTFHRFVTQGIYPGDWGEDKAIGFDTNIGNE